MTVELNAHFISELNESYPRQGDLLKEGDDHMRLIKSCLKQTLPSFNRTVNISAEKLNFFDGMTTFTSDTLTLGGNLSISEKKSLNFGGNVVKNAGDPVDDADLVTKKFFTDNIGNKAWPVGSIFVSAVSTDPSTLLGFGTWEQYGQGRCLMGVGSDKDDRGEAKLIALGAKGGAYNHVITAAETAAHSHSFSGNTSAGGDHTHGVPVTRGGDGGDGSDSGVPYVVQGGNTSTGGSGSHTHAFSGDTSATGSNSAHNNTHPWIGVYFWKRTA